MVAAINLYHKKENQGWSNMRAILFDDGKYVEEKGQRAQKLFEWGYARWGEEFSHLEYKIRNSYD